MDENSTEWLAKLEDWAIYLYDCEYADLDYWEQIEVKKSAFDEIREEK